MRTTLLTAGLGLKPAHFSSAVEYREPGAWFEVHPENYMVSGGPRLKMLESIRGTHPISLHGVGMSLASDASPDEAHLTRFTALHRRIQPALVSEHLAWSSRPGACFPDLLPFVRTRARLARIVENVSRVQQALQHRISIENPSHYLRIDGHEFEEIEFLTELARRSGCGLLLDVNNVFVSASNLGYDPRHYLDSFPGDLVAQVHLAGHSTDPVLGGSLLIDSHDAPVAPQVWALYEHLITRIGPRPTLIERDDRLPDFSELCAERRRAHALLQPQVELCP